MVTIIFTAISIDLSKGKTGPGNFNTYSHCLWTCKKVKTAPEQHMNTYFYYL